MNSPLDNYISFSHAKLPLPQSAHVDIILFLLKLKPCVRTELSHPASDRQSILSWCKSHGYLSYIDEEAFVYISDHPGNLKKVIEADRSPNKHEFLLGNLLGYPDCCSKKIGAVGEENIDAYEIDLCNQEFPPDFHIINPKAYREGSAMISHVPCSTTCQKSLQIARRFQTFLINHHDSPYLKQWLKEELYVPNI